MNRVFLTKLHLIAAAFMFPAILMFLGTGALYTWGNTGEWREETVTVELAQPLVAGDEAAYKALAETVLAERGTALPSGDGRIRGEGADESFSWSGARTEIEIAGTENPGLAEVTVKEATLHRWLVQLHKAKGSTLFKVYATALAVVLFLLVLSGVILGLQVKVWRRITINSSVIGVLAFVGFVMLG